MGGKKDLQLHKADNGENLLRMDHFEGKYNLPSLRQKWKL